MNERRLHPFTVLRFLRKTLVVYLLPLVQVLFERNWTALYTALRQDALLFPFTLRSELGHPACEQLEHG